MRLCHGNFKITKWHNSVDIRLTELHMFIMRLKSWPTRLYPGLADTWVNIHVHVVYIDYGGGSERYIKDVIV